MRALIFLDATWSSVGPLIEPVIRRVARAVRLPYLHLLVDKDYSLMQKYGVTGIPMLVLAEGEEVLGRWAGYRPENEIWSICSRVCTIGR